MPRVQKAPPTAFISYRRDDTAEFAQRLARLLKADLDRGRVFLDVLDIPPTDDDWWGTTEARLRSSDAAVVLIGPRYFAHEASDGQSADDAGGWALREIRAALETKTPLIRVLIDRELPVAEDWPADLQPAFGPKAQYLIVDSTDAGIRSTHQQVLAGVWVALVSRVVGDTGAVYVVSDGTAEAGQALDLLLNQIPRAAHVATMADLPEATGFRAVARADIERRFSETLPDVIIVTRGEPTDTLRERLRGMAACEAFAGTAATAAIISARAASASASPLPDRSTWAPFVTDGLGQVQVHLSSSLGDLTIRPPGSVTRWWAELSAGGKLGVAGGLAAAAVAIVVTAAIALSPGVGDELGTPSPGAPPTEAGPSTTPVPAVDVCALLADGFGDRTVLDATETAQGCRFLLAGTDTRGLRDGAGVEVAVSQNDLDAWFTQNAEDPSWLACRVPYQASGTGGGYDIPCADIPDALRISVVQIDDYVLEIRQDFQQEDQREDIVAAIVKSWEG